MQFSVAQYDERPTLDQKNTCSPLQLSIRFVTRIYKTVLRYLKKKDNTFPYLKKGKVFLNNFSLCDGCIFNCFPMEL